MSLTMDMNLTNAVEKTIDTLYFSPEKTSTPKPIIKSISVDEIYSEY